MANPDIISESDSVLPSVMRTQRWLILETLLKRLDGLGRYTLVMLFDIVNVSALDWLAEQLSLTGYDGWAFVETESEKRELLKAAIEIHRYKGTPWALKRALTLLGYGDSELVERVNWWTHNRKHNHDGVRRYDSVGHWTHYGLTFERPISRQEAEQIRIVAKDIAPLRCKLVSIKFKGLYHDGSIDHDAEYSRGEYKWND